MVRYLAIVVGLCIFSLLAAALLSASPEERLERSLSRMTTEEAVERFDQLYAEGDRTPGLLLQRARLLLVVGRDADARRTLRALAEDPTSRIVALEALGDLEVDLGEAAAAARWLGRAYEIEPDPDRLDRLARLLEALRRRDEEEALLAAADPAALTDRSAARLMELRAARGDMTGVERLLRARVDLPGPGRAERRGALVEVMAGDGRAAEAARLAIRWLAEDGDAEALALAVDRLLERGWLREAEALAFAAVEQGPPEAHVVVGAFAGSGHGSTARALLRAWLAANPRPDADGLAALAEYSRSMNDFSAARALLRDAEPSDFPPDFVLAVVKGSYARFGSAALPELRRHMTPQVLAIDPLFSAELAVGERDFAAAAHHLEQAAAEDLPPWRAEAARALVARISAAPVRQALYRALEEGGRAGTGP